MFEACNVQVICKLCAVRHRVEIDHPLLGGGGGVSIHTYTVNIFITSTLKISGNCIPTGLCCDVFGESSSRYPQTGGCGKNDRSQGIMDSFSVFIVTH